MTGGRQVDACTPPCCVKLRADDFGTTPGTFRDTWIHPGGNAEDTVESVLIALRPELTAERERLTDGEWSGGGASGNVNGDGDFMDLSRRGLFSGME